MTLGKKEQWTTVWFENVTSLTLSRSYDVYGPIDFLAGKLRGMEPMTPRKEISTGRSHEIQLYNNVIGLRNPAALRNCIMTSSLSDCSEECWCWCGCRLFRDFWISFNRSSMRRKRKVIKYNTINDDFLSQIFSLSRTSSLFHKHISKLSLTWTKLSIPWII